MRFARTAIAFASMALVSCMGAPAASTPLPSALQAGGTLRVAIPAEITTLDPWSADAPSLIGARQIFETLVVIDPATAAPSPGLASAWRSANDGAAWTFTLREGVRFHDGAPLDGPAVVASFERGRGTAAYKLLFDDPSVIARVDAPDAHTVRFELKAPFGPFLAHLAAPQTSIARRTSGTGPFVAPSGALAPDGTLTLRRNDAYWAKGPGGRQLPYLDGLVLRPVRDPPSRLAELRNGRAEIALDLPLAQATAARGDPNLVLPPPRDTALASLGIDITRPPFERADLRRAIALALDRAALAGLYGPTLRKATQVVPAGMLGYDDSVSEFAALDVAAAKRAVTDARVTTPITVDLAYPALPTVAYPDPQRVAQGISADLAKIGIVARLRAVDRPSVREGAAHLLLETTPIGLDPDDVFWPLFGGTDPLDVSLTVGLLRKARAEADPNKRAELYKQVSKLSRTEVTRIPLLFADRPSAASARVVGYADPNASFATIWLRP